MKLQHSILITRLENGFTIHSTGDEKGSVAKGKFVANTEREVTQRLTEIANNLFKPPVATGPAAGQTYSASSGQADKRPSAPTKP
jgi:hypothetical protein